MLELLMIFHHNDVHMFGVRLSSSPWVTECPDHQLSHARAAVQCPSARIIVASSLTEIIDLFIDGTVNEVSIVLCMNTKIYILRCGNAFYKTEVNYRTFKILFQRHFELFTLEFSTNLYT